MKALRIKTDLQRLHPQATEQLDRHRVGFVAGKHHCTKAPRIVQAQRAQVGHQIGVVVFAQ